MKSLFILLSLIFLGISASAESIRIDFTEGLKGWEEKVFKGHTDYRIVEKDGYPVLHAQSNGSASALIYRNDIDPGLFPKIRWRWKIDRVLKDGHAGIKSTDDYPARIYVIFDSWLPNYARSINYIWASRLERNAVVVSPYYRRSIMLAVESGNQKAGDWVVQERNLLEDYQRVFGGKIPRIKAVAVMTDTDDTGENAQAWYDWIEFVAAAQ